MVARSWIDPDTLLRAAVGDAFPAAQLVVVDQLEVVHALAVGAADEQTVFDIASLTKPLCTAYLTMLLCERGVVSRADRPRPDVTVDHLLCHASGLPGWKALTPQGEHAYLSIVEQVRREQLLTVPGTHAVYSDLGFILLGAHLEERSLSFLEVMFAHEIARPLGVATGFFPPDHARCAPCEGLRGVVHDDNARAMGGAAGHAGLFSTAHDVATIAQSLLASFLDRPAPRLVSPSTVRDFWTPSAVPGSTWCYGWDRPSPTGSSAGERWPKNGVGHLGFTGCSLWLDPPRGRAVVLLSNRVEPTRDNDRIRTLRPRLHDAIVRVLDGD